MGLSFILAEKQDVNEHSYRVYNLDVSDMNSWLEALADEYIHLRTTKNARLKNLSTNGIEIVDTTLVNTQLLAFKRRKLRASIPFYQPGNLEVLRSDLGELLNYVLLENHYNTIILKKSIEKRKTPYKTALGIDTVGIEQLLPLALIISEVKVSNEKASPPQVVNSPSMDSLRVQHSSHLKNLLIDGGTFDKIADLCKDIEDENIAQSVESMQWYLFNKDWDNLHLVACSVLVRPQAMYKQKDFGIFFTNPDEFNPARIRFLIVRVPYDIDTVVRMWDNIIVKRLENYL